MRTPKIITAIAILCISYTNAQQVMRFYMKNGSTQSYVVSTIDSLKFKPSPKQLPTVTDIDGNVYHYITIGTQTWMVENLRTTRYRNGDVIGTTTTSNQDIKDETAPKYQWPANGNENLIPQYGRLYTGYAATEERNIAPEGWRVANAADWQVLVRYLQANGYNYDLTSAENKIAKSMAATSGWAASSTVGSPGKNPETNNKSGFTAYPAGWRTRTGSFQYVGTQAIWWAISPEKLAYESGINIVNTDINYQSTINLMHTGMAIRCIKE